MTNEGKAEKALCKNTQTQRMCLTCFLWRDHGESTPMLRTDTVALLDWKCLAAKDSTQKMLWQDHPSYM
jgi:hypothetical protein